MNKIDKLIFICLLFMFFPESASGQIYNLQSFSSSAIFAIEIFKKALEAYATFVFGYLDVNSETNCLAIIRMVGSSYTYRGVPY